VPAAHAPHLPDAADDGAVSAPTPASVVAHGPVIWAMAGQMHAAHHVLDPAAAILWQCLDGATPLSVIFADIAQAFGAPEQQVAADCLPVVHSWLLAGIVLQVPAHAGAATPAPVPEPAPVPAEGELARTWRRLVDPPSS
jgi:hypothetical protein